MQIITIYPRGFGSNTYALTEDNERAIVIDPAQSGVAWELEKRGLKCEYVLLTHCHFDHVGGVPALQEKGAKVLCSEEEKPLIGTDADLFAVFGAPAPFYTVDKTLRDNEEITLCGISIKVLLTPGHTKGSCCYLVTAKDGGRYLFTGDTLFADSIGRTDFPTGNLGQLCQSLRRLKSIEEDLPIFAGHQESTTLSKEKKTNPFLTDL